MEESKRLELIGRLQREAAQTVLQWALSDYDSLEAYVAESERFEDRSDEELLDIAEERFGMAFESCGKEKED